jgi:hypothetical protein
MKTGIWKWVHEIIGDLEAGVWAVLQLQRKDSAQVKVSRWKKLPVRVKESWLQGWFSCRGWLWGVLLCDWDACLPCPLSRPPPLLLCALITRFSSLSLPWVLLCICLVICACCPALPPPKPVAPWRQECSSNFSFLRTETAKSKRLNGKGTQAGKDSVVDSYPSVSIRVGEHQNLWLLKSLI